MPGGAGYDALTVARGDVAGQTRQVFEDIRATHAESVDTMDVVIKITIFASDNRYCDVIRSGL
jgi:enamine deaminase RidA (YjgF/YER057c/UK114 family)